MIVHAGPFGRRVVAPYDRLVFIDKKLGRELGPGPGPGSR